MGSQTRGLRSHIRLLFDLIHLLFTRIDLIFILRTLHITAHKQFIFVDSNRLDEKKKTKIKNIVLTEISFCCLTNHKK